MFDLYIRYEYLVASAQLTFAMLGMGATVSLRDFADVFRFPRGIVMGSVMQLMLVPLVGWLFIQTFDMSAGVVIGLALCVAIPGGTTSNIFTYLARGNVALSISMTSVSTLACLASTPIILSLLASGHMPSDFSMPIGKVVADMLLFVLLPLVLGMVFAARFPHLATPFFQWCIRISVGLILLMVIGSAGAGRLDMDAYGADNAKLLLLFIIVLVVVSMVIPMLFRLSVRDVTAVNMEITVRNTNLALLIKVSMFPAVVGVSDPIGDAVLFTVLLYAGYQMLLSVVLIALGRFRETKVPATAQPGINQ